MLPKGPYQPQLTEEEILKFWLENKFYAPEFSSDKELSTSNLKDRENFTIVLPPPNANGNLHLGHMSGYAYQDLMARFQRMMGKRVLLLPGKDHAGIQTEVVFERELEKQGKSKREIGREEFYKQCYEFCLKNSETARQQEQKIGLSADFDRELFTLDPRIVEEVLKAFELMYEDGLVYRDKRIINWCPRCQSALADIDTEFKDSQTPFYYFKYGFTEPEQEALKLKKEYEGKMIEVEIKLGKNHESVIKEMTANQEKYFDGKVRTHYFRAFIPGTRSSSTKSEIDTIVFGFTELEHEEKINVQAIGIIMSLDNNFRIIVKNPDISMPEIKEDLNLFRKFLVDKNKNSAGTHIILFDDYPEDKYYTNGFILGTVRPETKFGDTALAVDPDDGRYKEFVGKEFEVQTLLGTSKIKVIADNAVEENFGTGMVKVTPAHSPEDWDIAKRHPEDALPEKQVIDFDGKMNHLAGKYQGMKVKEARLAMIDDMKANGMLIYQDDTYTNRLRICERCKHPIEPLVSYQWFVDTKPLKEEAKRLVENGSTEIMPEGKKKTFFQWMNQDEDWCITRQLWWGYRLPVWYKGKRDQYITETGEVKERIAGKVIESPDDYRGILHVGRENPQSAEKIELTVVRHGETDYNKQGKFHGKTDIELSQIGIEQAEKLSVNLEGDFDVIISSPLKRARTTAEIINSKLKLEIVENELILERDFGNLEGLTWEEFSEKFPEEASKNNPDFQEYLEKGETIPEVESRVDLFFEWLKISGVKKPLIVTHAGIIRVMERKLKSLTHEQSRQNDPENTEVRTYLLNLQDWYQDEDVLDTWFSSGQWPYLTLKARPEDFKFYPTQVMETGWDILLFWVTRMMLLNPYRAKKLNPNASDNEVIPFKDVYLHGLVLDKNGIKMSKSKGNGIDPFEMMQKYGTDALRFSFIKGNSVGQNYRLYEEKISSNRNFCNKIWNATKFVLFNIEDASNTLVTINKEDLQLTQDDTELLEELAKLTAETTRRLTEFQFGIAAEELYESFWHNFADIYLEKIKTRLYSKDREGNAINTSPEELESRRAAQWVILHAIDTYLKLLHPFMPFLTEKLWQELPKREGESETIMYSQWPK